jgi:hypothetical protein
MGLNGADTVLRLSPFENLIQDFSQLAADHPFSFETVSLLRSR